MGGSPGALGPTLLHPTDCYRRQDTGYKIPDTAHRTQIQEYRSRGIRRCKYARMHRIQATGMKQMPRSLVAPLSSGRRIPTNWSSRLPQRPVPNIDRHACYRIPRCPPHTFPHLLEFQDSSTSRATKCFSIERLLSPQTPPSSRNT